MGTEKAVRPSLEPQAMAGTLGSLQKLEEAGMRRPKTPPEGR